RLRVIMPHTFRSDLIQECYRRAAEARLIAKDAALPTSNAAFVPLHRLGHPSARGATGAQGHPRAPLSARTSPSVRQVTPTPPRRKSRPLAAHLLIAGAGRIDPQVGSDRAVPRRVGRGERDDSI